MTRTKCDENFLFKQMFDISDIAEKMNIGGHAYAKRKKCIHVIILLVSSIYGYRLFYQRSFDLQNESNSLDLIPWSKHFID